MCAREISRGPDAKGAIRSLGELFYFLVLFLLQKVHYVELHWSQCNGVK